MRYVHGVIDVGSGVWDFAFALFWISFSDAVVLRNESMAASSGTSGNGKKARAAVMRYGYRQGEFFEGYSRCGKGTRCPGSSRRFSAGNTANPMAGTGCKIPEFIVRSKPLRW